MLSTERMRACKVFGNVVKYMEVLCENFVITAKTDSGNNPEYQMSVD